MKITFEMLEALIIVILGIIAIIASYNGQLDLETVIAGGLIGFIGTNIRRTDDISA